MTKLNRQSDWTHSNTAPLRWLRAAVATVDEQLAVLLCINQWRRPQAIRIAAHRELRTPRSFR